MRIAASIAKLIIISQSIHPICRYRAARAAKNLPRKHKLRKNLHGQAQTQKKIYPGAHRGAVHSTQRLQSAPSSGRQVRRDGGELESLLSSLEKNNFIPQLF